jgi:para-nitrobenzyl esterase
VPSTEVRTNTGRVSGATDRGVTRYLGIPFAAPPFGIRRFHPPEAAAKWDGVRVATAPGDACLQPTLDPNTAENVFYNPPGQGPDCLNLNIWTPSPGAGKLPVMVWIHGGGYIAGGGAAPAHDGYAWARDGVVYVSINYRLNLDGFMYLGGDTANLGLQDAVAALRWVHENISAFGGDPGNVTIFGQSGGAVSVMNLLAMPSAAGLFRRAISQSGSTEGTASVDLASRLALRFSELLGRKPTVPDLMDVSDEAVRTAAAAFAFEYILPSMWGSEAFIISPFRSVIDGSVLPGPIVSLVSSGASASVDLMAGTTRDEMTFAMQPLGMLETVDPTWASMALAAFGLSRSALDAYTRESRKDADEAELFQAAWTDWAFRVPTLRLLEAHIPHPGRTFAYEFAWPTPLPRLGATHALECPFVKDNLADTAAALPELMGDDPPQVLADTMHRAWVSFATSGDPGWPQYDLDRRVTMRFDVNSAPVDDLAGGERKIWDGIR